MEVLLEVLEETIIMLPMLFIMYLILEYSELHNYHFLDKLKKQGPLYGALLGVIPQCGISVIASILFLERKITIGTLISIYIATSDEAIPLLLSNPSMSKITLSVVVVKFITAIIFGYLIDYFIKIDFEKKEIKHHHHDHSLWKCAIERTLKIYLFIFVIHLGLSYLFEYIGEDTLSVILLNQSYLQPIVSSFFGIIPHCVVSVVLTELYSNGLLSFASLISGLMSNAGMGLLVLIEYKINPRVFAQVIGILLGCSIIAGIVIQIL